MKKLLKRDGFVYLLYILISVAGIWMLSNFWVPKGFTVSGHDSGLALNAGEFVKTRLFAWDDRMGFGTDNSPHFGSIIFHSIDYMLSLFAGTGFAGNQVAVFFWISMLFIFASLFAWSLINKLGRVFAYFFPVFMTFNFFIFQSIFILERAKYELVCVTLLFLTLALKILFDEIKFSWEKILGYSIIFSVVVSIFNGGSWMGLPLYGGLLVAGFTYLFFALIMSFREKNYIFLMKALTFGGLSLILFTFLNLYSILPFFSTLVTSDYAKVVGSDTIAGGKAWLDYLSRGTFFVNLFRFQGVPEWYLTGGLPNPDYAYAPIYLTNGFLVFISFLLPVISLSGVFYANDKKEKNLIGFFIVLLLVSMFFTSGTNSPIGFLYNILYEKVPGFSIFRSPYYKFASIFTLSYSLLMAFSFAKLGQFLISKINKKFLFATSSVFIFLIIFGWFAYNFVIFNRNNLFSWQSDKSTLVQIPSYVPEFDNWLKDNEFNGRALMVPALDSYLGNDNYSWGYWSLATLPSVLFTNGTFITNDTNNTPVESDWINTLYALFANKNPEFLNLSAKLGINYLFVRNDFKPEDVSLLQKYSDTLNWLSNNNQIVLVKSIGPWSLYSIKNGSDDIFTLSNSIYSVPQDHIYLAKELVGLSYGNGLWIDSENGGGRLKTLVSEQFIPLNCESCSVENLGKYADVPPVNILPNSPLYIIKKSRNEKALKSATDDNSKLGTYLGLILTKFSEIRSMYDLKIEKQYILEDLTDIEGYFQNMNNIISKSDALKNNFYFLERVYETANPIQKYFRDYISSSDFDVEKPEIRTEILNVLWQTHELKSQYSNFVGNGDKWNFEKNYDLNLPQDGQYKFMIDNATLPVDGYGGHILPSSISVENSGNLNTVNILNNRWIFTNPQNILKNGSLVMKFPSFPNLYKFIGANGVSFPLGQRGCVIGTINSFDKNRNYVLGISSIGFSGSSRLYIVEDTKKNGSNQFLKGDIETDVSLNPGGNSYKYYYTPISSANDPMIYLCGFDSTIPQGIEINVREIVNPSIYAISSNYVNSNSAKLEFNRVSQTEYKIKTDKLNGDMVLAFNETYNSLWQLKNENGAIIEEHFLVNGYANGWFLPSGKSYNLTLTYKPQELFLKGLKISAAALIILTAIFIIVSKRAKNDKN